MTDSDEKNMTLALNEAGKAARLGEIPVGAVIIGKEGDILAMGYNSPIASSDPTAHAEIVALRKACQKACNYRLIGVTVYVTIEPCPMCMCALLHARVSRLVYGATAPKWGAAGTLFNFSSDPRFNHTIEVTSGVLEKGCREILQAFFARQRQHKEDIKNG
ncbi:MAG: tRNA adenosine(34) deaminase TadA [Pseudomonadota bacterium]